MQRIEHLEECCYRKRITDGVVLYDAARHETEVLLRPRCLLCITACPGMFYCSYATEICQLLQRLFIK